jgi:hypothetical protein
MTKPPAAGGRARRRPGSGGASPVAGPIVIRSPTRATTRHRVRSRRDARRGATPSGAATSLLAGFSRPAWLLLGSAEQGRRPGLPRVVGAPPHLRARR